MSPSRSGRLAGVPDARAAKALRAGSAARSASRVANNAVAERGAGAPTMRRAQTPRTGSRSRHRRSVTALDSLGEALGGLALAPNVNPFGIERPGVMAAPHPRRGLWASVAHVNPLY